MSSARSKSTVCVSLRVWQTQYIEFTWKPRRNRDHYLPKAQRQTGSSRRTIRSGIRPVLSVRSGPQIRRASPRCPSTVVGHTNRSYACATFLRFRLIAFVMGNVLIPIAYNRLTRDHQTPFPDLSDILNIPVLHASSRIARVYDWSRKWENVESNTSDCKPNRVFFYPWIIA